MIVLTWGAVDPETGEPFRWDSPNLRWGSPSYALTRGDYGWQPPPGEKVSTRNRNQTMKHQTYYPSRTGDQITWLSNFYHKLPAWAATLGLSAPVLAEVIADARWLIYVLQDWLPAVRAYSQAATAAARNAETGSSGSVALPVFTAPALPGPEGTLPAVVPKAEGGLRRIFDLIREWKQNNACTDVLCEDLRIVGPERSSPDYAALQVALTGRRNGAQVELTWGWQGYSEFLDACEIEVDRGTGYAMLVMDSTPGYTDSHPQPATPTVWKYRAWFRADDVRVGVASAELSVLVGGP